MDRFVRLSSCSATGSLLTVSPQWFLKDESALVMLNSDSQFYRMRYSKYCEAN